MTTDLIESVRDRSLELSLAELAGDAAPPDRSQAITERWQRVRSATPAPRSVPAARRRTPWLAAALVVLAIGATTWVQALSQDKVRATGPTVFFLDGSTLVALDFRTGKEQWTLPVAKGSYGKPITHGGVVYLGSADGRLVAVDAAKGKLAWQRQIGGKGFAFDGREPFVIDDAGIVCTLRKGAKQTRCALVDPRTGATRWSRELTGGVAGYAFAGKRLLAQGPRGQLQALRLDDGKPAWAIDLLLRTPHAPLVHGGLAYVSCKRKLCAVRHADGTLAWKYRSITGKPPMSAPVVVGQQVIVATSSLMAFGLEGSLMWKGTGIGHNAILRVVGDRLAVTDHGVDLDDKHGRLSFFLAKTGQPRSTRILDLGPPAGLTTHGDLACVVLPGRVFAYRATDSMPMWNRKLTGEGSAPCFALLEGATAKPEAKAEPKKKR